MTVNLEEIGLSSIVDEFDLFFIDIWGVLHNGIKLNPDAINVLERLNDKNKDYVLLTNAPRPNSTVINFLKKMGLAKLHCEKVYTSGEAALSFLNKKSKQSKFFHIGPPRDFDLFKDLEKNKSNNIDESDYILCTGLFDDHDKDLNYYKDLLNLHLKKKMICTNPDLIVDRGNLREFCAGSVAMVFEKMGGDVLYFGKPYPEVYNQSINNKEKKVLSIGDNLNTDIKGANLLNYDSLIISNGIHKFEIEKNGIKETAKSYEAICNYIQSELKW